MKVMKNQDNKPDGMTRFFCSACMGSFFAPRMPAACPAGHPATARADDFGSTPATLREDESVA